MYSSNYSSDIAALICMLYTVYMMEVVVVLYTVVEYVQFPQRESSTSVYM